MLVVVACESDEQSPAARAAKARPRHASARIFVNNKALGRAHGCDGPFAAGEMMTCGPTGGALRLDWMFVESRPEGDTYEISFARQQGRSGATGGNLSAAISSAKLVVYVGEPLVVFEDESQVVLIYPGAIENRPTVDDATRAPGV